MSGAAATARAAALALADALSYPDGALPARLRAGAARLGDGPGAALARLAGALEALGGGGAEELYTTTFDLGAAVSPYVGALLCGDGPRRTALLVHLAERRAAAGLGAGAEPPDHVAEVLRLAAAAPEDEAAELVEVALAPAARAALAALPEGNPYRGAFEALLGALAPAAAVPPPEEVPR